MVGDATITKVCVLGATGRTGLAFLERATIAGLHLRTVVRNPDRLGRFQQCEAVESVKADVRDPQSLVKALSGVDAVVSLLGPNGINPHGLYTQAYSSITQAMRSAGVERLIALTSSGHENDPNFPLFFRWFLKPLVLKKLYSDMAEAETVIEGTSLAWTIVRPSMFVAHQPGRAYRINDRVNPAGGWKISREDIADFVLSELLHPQWVRRYPAAAY